MVDDALRLIASPHFWRLLKLAGLVWFFLAVADALPHPASTRPWWITLPYGIVQGLAGNIRRVCAVIPRFWRKEG